MNGSIEYHGDVKLQWNVVVDKFGLFKESLDRFVVIGSEKCNMFAYWSQFLTVIAPVLRDLTRSFREADRDLHLSSVNRAIDLAFTFDRINYKR